MQESWSSSSNGPHTSKLLGNWWHSKKIKKTLPRLKMSNVHYYKMSHVLGMGGNQRSVSRVFLHENSANLDERDLWFVLTDIRQWSHTSSSMEALSGMTTTIYGWTPEHLIMGTKYWKHFTKSLILSSKALCSLINIYSLNQTFFLLCTY